MMSRKTWCLRNHPEKAYQTAEELEILFLEGKGDIRVEMITLIGKAK